MSQSTVPSKVSGNPLAASEVNNIVTAVNSKQDQLVSATNIKTINGNSLLGSGDIVISSGGSVTIDSTQYKVLISQSGTAAPTPNVLGTNTIGNIVWTRVGPGDFLGTLANAFTNLKTDFTYNTATLDDGQIDVRRVNANQIRLYKLDGTDGLTNFSLKIHVYS